MLFRFLGKYALAGLIAVSPAIAAHAQAASAEHSMSANELARAVVANELKVQEGNHSRWMYRADREEQGRKKTKEVVQTGQGSLDRLLAVEGRGR